jgi:glycosyltransferase involved in cell wall biosynthesis
MSVAVIIPLWNGSAWIRQTLDSVLAQEFRPREVVVVDDGSSDGSPDIVRDYREVMLLKNPDKGSSGARNFGLAHTTAPLVAFLDQDDLWHKAHLKLLYNVLRRAPDLPAVVASTSSFRDGEQPCFDVTPTSTERIDPWVRYPFLGPLKPPTPSAVLIQRAALNEVGNWDPTYLGAVDYYLWLRLSEKRPLVRLGATTVGYRQHSASQKNRLLSSDGLGYLHRHTRASCDALEHRLPRIISPTERAILERRRDVGLSVYSLAKAIVERDQGDVMQVARRLEILLKNESAAFRQSPFRELAWFLSRMVNPADESRGRNALLADLYQAWPSDAMQTRETLRDLVRLQRFHLFFVVNPLFRESSWPQRFALLLTAFRRKIRALTNPPKAPFQ